MKRMKWDQIGDRRYKVGVDHGGIYPQKNGAYPVGHAWSGLTKVDKTPSGAEDNKLYADNMQYLNIKSAESLGLNIECYFYPDAFKECNGETEVAAGVSMGQQRRNTFGFVYRTKIGNDTEGEDFGFELNLVYGCSASPSEQSSETINESPEPGTFSFEVSTTPMTVSGVGPDGKPYKPTACLTIDSTKVKKEKLAQLEEILYGKEGEYDPEPLVVNEGDIVTDEPIYELINGQYINIPEGEELFVDHTYYKVISPPIEGRLPLPDEIIMLFAEG